jgi:hypothetical protein
VAQGVDCATFAAHKFHGPKGIGIGYARKGFAAQAHRHRRPAGARPPRRTENVPGIVGAGKAAEIAKAHLADMAGVARCATAREKRFSKRSTKRSSTAVASHRTPNTTNISFALLESERSSAAERAGRVRSAGAACSSGSLEPSHVMRAMKVPDRVAHGAVRFSLSRYSTEDDRRPLPERAARRDRQAPRRSAGCGLKQEPATLPSPESGRSNLRMATPLLIHLSTFLLAAVLLYATQVLFQALADALRPLLRCVAGAADRCVRSGLLSPVTARGASRWRAALR